MLNYNDFLIREYIENDIIYLKKYMNQSDEEKALNLPFGFSYLFPQFCEDEGIEIDDVDISDIDIHDIASKDSVYYDYFLAFGEWLFDNIEDLDIPSEELPTWTYFDNPTLVKNQWLVHFTDEDAAYDISKNGFTKGVYDVSKLGLTTCLSEWEKTGGYNFCYTIDDFTRYADNRHGYKYGDYCVIFRGSGIRMYHNSDEEYQTIFYGKLAKDIHIIEEIDGEWTINSKKGKRLYADENLEKVVDWFIDNYNQYKNVI